MRRLILLSLFAATWACSSSTGPAPTSIAVRVRDDAGVPVASMPVRVMFGSSRLDSRTRDDGTVNIAVSSSGSYLVWVVPRAGYIGSADALSKTIEVSPNSVAVVDFTVIRQGTSTADPPVGGYQ